MDRKRLGSTTVQLPEIGMGTWKYSGGVEPLRVGIGQGACLIDTAEIYGTEEIVGQSIQGLRSRVFLATKVAPRNFRRRNLIAAAERSLRKLGTEYIDLYQLHWPNYVVPVDEPLSAMEDLVEAGKVRFIGVSNFSVNELQRAQAALIRNKIVSNQVSYSLVDRSAERDLLNYCQQNRITVIAYSPLGAGLEQIRLADTEGVLADIARTSGKSEAQIALNWLIVKDGVVAIPKAASVAHTLENCSASGWRLAESEYRLLEEKIHCRRRAPLVSAMRRWKRRSAQLIGRAL